MLKTYPTYSDCILPLFEYIKARAARTVLVVKGGASLNDLTQRDLALTVLESRFDDIADTGIDAHRSRTISTPRRRPIRPCGVMGTRPFEKKRPDSKIPSSATVTARIKNPDPEGPASI